MRGVCRERGRGGLNIRGRSVLGVGLVVRGGVRDGVMGGLRVVEGFRAVVWLGVGLVLGMG